jgi:hypothetical protein
VPCRKKEREAVLCCLLILCLHLITALSVYINTQYAGIWVGVEWDCSEYSHYRFIVLTTPQSSHQNASDIMWPIASPWLHEECWVSTISIIAVMHNKGMYRVVMLCICWNNHWDWPSENQITLSVWFKHTYSVGSNEFLLWPDIILCND